MPGKSIGRCDVCVVLTWWSKKKRLPESLSQLITECLIFRLGFAQLEATDGGLKLLGLNDKLLCKF